ncbi:hypothetical protein [Pararhodobacter zhoushanensis]|uniref:hypothetical protein n=1 Tax=Pararhodobacter zhoushanensis TaxID=2479545 RepID=UPI000F8D2340|nr:hypothetical protein [Pararhodobacter zhoushanensis]
MIQVRGLHGVPLAAPASRALAEAIGLTFQTLDPDALPMDAPELSRSLTRRALRVLHAIGQSTSTPDAILATLAVDQPTKEQVTDTLYRLRKLGLVARAGAQSSGTNRPSIWRRTPLGAARALLDMTSISDSEILDAVRAINARDLAGRPQWWPVTCSVTRREPATTDKVCRYLFAKTKSARAIGKVAPQLVALTSSGALIAADWNRGDVVSRLYWAAAHG